MAQMHLVVASYENGRNTELVNARSRIINELKLIFLRLAGKNPVQIATSKKNTNLLLDVAYFADGLVFVELTKERETKIDLFFDAKHLEQFRRECQSANINVQTTTCDQSFESAWAYLHSCYFKH